MTGQGRAGAPLRAGDCTVAVVTGATGGLGSVLSGLCARAAGRGDLLGCVLLCRRPEGLPPAVASEGSVSAVAHDAGADDDGIARMLGALDGFQGARRAVVVHTSFSMPPLGHVGGFREGDVRSNLAANVLDLVRLANSLSGWSRARGIPLRFVNIDSGAAYRPVDGWSLYCSAKAYTNMFLRCCAGEGAMEAVTYEPGVIDTGMQRLIRETPADRCGEVETFRRLRNEGALNDPGDVARDIFARFVLGWERGPFEMGYRR